MSKRSEKKNQEATRNSVMFRPRVNITALSRYFKAREINIDGIPRKVACKAAIGYLKTCHTTVDKAEQVVFGTNLTAAYDYFAMHKAILAAHEVYLDSIVKVSKDPVTKEGLEKSFSKVTGTPAPFGASENWLRNAIRNHRARKKQSQLAKVDKIKYNKKKSDKEALPTPRSSDCKLDDQAKELRIYNSEIPVKSLVPNENYAFGNGEPKLLNVWELMNYHEAPRKARQEANHVAYKYGFEKANEIFASKVHVAQ